MKRYVLSIIAAACILVGTSAIAGANEALHDMVVTIPFEFTVGEATLPRGTYRVTRASAHPDVLLLSNLTRSVYLVGQRDTSGDRKEPTAFVFHRRGDQHFLRELRFIAGVRFDVPETRAEREAEERLARSQPKAEVVVVDANTR
jgi:hypothetical protein